MKPPIRIAIPGDDPPQLLGSPHLDRLRAWGEVVLHADRPADDAEKVRRAQGAICMINSRSAVKWPREVLKQLPDLKMITVCGIGTDSIDIAAARELGILVCNIPGKTAAIVAEHALALMLAAARRLVDQTLLVRSACWKTGETKYLGGKTLGVLGAGPIGLRMMRLGRAIGMNVQAWTFHPSPERAHEVGVPFVPLEELFKTSDVVSIHLKLSPETRGMVGRREIGWMKPGSILVNTGRGAVVDARALADALHAGHLWGAGVDVFDPEPVSANDPLIGCPNIVMTPHVADQNPEGMEILNGGAVDNVIAFLEGRPQFVVNG